MKKITRVDMFTNLDEYIKFMEWAKTKEPKTRADMVRLLAEYKQPDLLINEHPEVVEHRITQKFNVKRISKKDLDKPVDN